MFKTFKWLWDKAQHYGQERVIALIHSRAEYHRMMAETAHLKQKYQPDDDDGPMRKFERPRSTPQEHSAIANALHSVITDFMRMYENEEGNDGR